MSAWWMDKKYQAEMKKYNQAMTGVFYANVDKPQRPAIAFPDPRMDFVGLSRQNSLASFFGVEPGEAMRASRYASLGLGRVEKRKGIKVTPQVVVEADWIETVAEQWGNWPAPSRVGTAAERPRVNLRMTKNHTRAGASMIDNEESWRPGRGADEGLFGKQVTFGGIFLDRTVDMQEVRSVNGIPVVD